MNQPRPQRPGGPASAHPPTGRFSDTYARHVPNPRGWRPAPRVWAATAGLALVSAAVLVGAPQVPTFVNSASEIFAGPPGPGDGAPPAASASPSHPRGGGGDDGRSGGTPAGTVQAGAAPGLAWPGEPTPTPSGLLLPTASPPVAAPLIAPPLVAPPYGSPTPVYLTPPTGKAAGATPAPSPDASAQGPLPSPSPSPSRSPRKVVVDAHGAVDDAAGPSPSPSPSPSGTPTPSPELQRPSPPPVKRVRPAAPEVPVDPRASEEGDPAGPEPRQPSPGGSAAPSRSAAPRVRDAALVGHQSGRCVDATDQGQLRIWDCNGSEGQRWRFGPGRTLRSLGMCMDVASATDGAAIRLTSCDGGPNQVFKLNAVGDLHNIGTNKCVDAYNEGTENGVRLVLWPCTGAPNQKWSLRLNG